VKIYINNRLYEFSKSELIEMYVDEGKEGVVYQYGDYALKIYHPCSRKERLSESLALKLMKIDTKRILLPLGLIYNSSKKFCGYYTNVIINNSLDYISNMRLKYLYDEIKAFEDDLDILTDKHIEINDFNMLNALYDGSFYMCDPGSYFFNNDCSITNLERMNREKLIQFFVENVIGKDCSIKKRNNISKYFQELSIPFSTQLANIGQADETIRQFVKRIS